MLYLMVQTLSVLIVCVSLCCILIITRTRLIVHVINIIECNKIRCGILEIHVKNIFMCNDHGQKLTDKIMCYHIKN